MSHQLLPFVVDQEMWIMHQRMQ